MNKQEANKIIQLISKECKANRECAECNFYIYDEENDLDGCIFNEVREKDLKDYEL